MAKLNEEKVCDLYVCVHNSFYMAEIINSFVSFLHILADLQINTIRLCIDYDRVNVFKDVFESQHKLLPQLSLKYESKDLELNNDNTVKNYTVIITDNGFNIIYPNNRMLNKYIDICKMFRGFYNTNN